MIRSIWVGLNLVAATVILSTWLFIRAAFGADEKVFDKLSRLWTSWILKRSGVTIHVEGLENVRLDAPQIFLSNHQSWYDVFALVTVIPKRCRFVGKKELLYIPVFGQAWKVLGHISVDRQDRAAAIRALDEAGELIRRDASSIVIFPEGTRSPDGRLLPFKKGGFMLALRTGVDIVPVGVSGGRAIMPKGKWRIRSGPIIVRFGEPIPMRDWSLDRREELMAEVRSRIESLLDSPVTTPRTS